MPPPDNERFNKGWIGELNRLCERAPDDARFVMFIVSGPIHDTELITIANMNERSIVRRFVNACLKRFMGQGRQVMWPQRGGQA